MAFHRLYQQINAESIGVPCGSLSPGMVDTEGKYIFSSVLNSAMIKVGVVTIDMSSIGIKFENFMQAGCMDQG